MAALDRQGADRLDHAGIGHGDNAESGLLDAEAERFGDVALDGPAGEARIDSHLAAQVLSRIENAERHRGIGHGSPTL